MARCLEELGHEVIVADPSFAPMYGMRTRRVKTDERDARALAEACRSGVYRLAQRMSERPRIGPVTAASFRAAVDDVKRLRGPHPLAAYLGLVPRETSSGERQHRGRITRTGDSRTRSLLVQAAQRIRYSAMMRDSRPFDPTRQAGVTAALAA